MDRWNSIEEAMIEPSSKRRKRSRLVFPQQQQQQQKVLLASQAATKWSEMSQDTLELILARLPLGDRIQSSRVCKHWRSVAMPTYVNPCLFRFVDSNKRCVITDYTHNESFTIETPNIPAGAEVAYSNKGWLLLVEKSTVGIDLFFFDPLTQAKIQLPKLESFFCSKYTFSFSSQPTSSDCMVIGLQALYAADSTFYCWVPGENKWETLCINHQESIFRASPHSKPFLFKNQIYHVEDEGRLGIYNLSNRKLTIIGKMPTRIDMCSLNYYNFVDVDGKLVFVYNDFYNGHIYLYEFDDSKKQWVRLESTGRRSVFFCTINCMLVKATPSSEGEDKHVYAWDIFGREIMMPDLLVRNQLQFEREFEDVIKHDSYEDWINACWIDLKG